MCPAGPHSGGGGGNSAGTGGGSGRRLVSEFPPHIQQLLDQQERQAFERGSPMRRPVYRKLVAGSGLAPSIQYDGSLPTYLLPGIHQHLLGRSFSVFVVVFSGCVFSCFSGSVFPLVPCFLWSCVFSGPVCFLWSRVFSGCVFPLIAHFSLVAHCVHCLLTLIAFPL